MSIPTPIARQQRIHSARVGPACLAVPPGHVGPLTLPGSGRTVWWTGRVAIGLRHEAPGGTMRAVSSSALWIQSLLLGDRGRGVQAG